MGCGNSAPAEQPKPPAPAGPAGPTSAPTTAPSASPSAASSDVPPASVPVAATSPAVAPAAGSQTAAENPRAGEGRLSALGGLAGGVFKGGIPKNMNDMKAMGQRAKDAAKGAGAIMGEVIQGQMEAALASSDNKRINSILDSAMAGTALGGNAPDVMRRAASQVASKQLRDAIASEDPKQLKGALVAAKRLNSTSVPEFQSAVDKYKEVKKLPPGWDVKHMVLQRVGDTMVAKLNVSDPEVHQKFQHLLDLTHRKVYTRDRLGQAVPERLELKSVTAITNEELWGDYMARRETIRREIEADPSDFKSYSVDTQAESESAPSAASIAKELAADFGEPLMPDVNEAFLFHGTSAAAADSITTGNFSVNLAGSNAGTLYGRGVYLAENASKSDEYTRPGKEDLRYLILCRAVMGRTLYLDTPNTDPRECEEACLRGKFHGVLGDRKKCRGTFREFIVFDEDQVYPNYILAYKRIDPAVQPKKTFRVICPDGVTAGQTVQVTSPDGVSMQVTVPPGVSPGQEFEVECPDPSTGRTMMVICPPSAPPGTTVQVRAPNGKDIMVLVPPGVAAGQQFQAQW